MNQRVLYFKVRCTQSTNQGEVQKHYISHVSFSCRSETDVSSLLDVLTWIFHEKEFEGNAKVLLLPVLSRIYKNHFGIRFDINGSKKIGTSSQVAVCIVRLWSGEVTLGVQREKLLLIGRVYNVEVHEPTNPQRNPILHFAFPSIHTKSREDVNLKIISWWIRLYVYLTIDQRSSEPRRHSPEDLSIRATGIISSN